MKTSRKKSYRKSRRPIKRKTRKKTISRKRSKSRNKRSPKHIKNILFTITTFISYEGKLKQLKNALDSIKRQEPNINKYCDVILINECGDTSAKFLKETYPWIDKIIDKGKRKSGKNCGQAASLNLIIDTLKKNKKYKYWIHWEESWVAKKPFIETGIEAMEVGISQLQFTEDLWQKYNDGRVRLPNGKYVYIQKRFRYTKYKSCKRKSRGFTKGKYNKNFTPNTACKEKNFDPKNWPLWSLRPGIDNVDDVLDVGYFTQNPKFWPVHFELEWAYNWAFLDNKPIKAGIELVHRQKSHVSFSEKYKS